jgi:uncharacterized protein (DUF1501 family)
MMNRRQWIRRAGFFAGVTALGGVALPRIADAGDYKALVVIHLDGGNDGNNMLVPTDGAYADYEKARTSELALPKDSLLTLSGRTAGHTFGLHPALADLRPLYESRRLAFISNVGALIEPATRELVLANRVRLPIGLFSHNDASGFVMGSVEDSTGWGGRGLESLDASLRHPGAAVAVGRGRTLVSGRRTAVSYLPGEGNASWGFADLLRPEDAMPQTLLRMGNWQSSNDYENAYSGNLRVALADTTLFGRVGRNAAPHRHDFGNNYIGQQLRYLSSLLPGLKAYGLRRQIFQVNFGGFDHHIRQRGSDSYSQDSLLAQVSKALAAFDAANRDNGVDGQVLTIVGTEFGRTLRPGSGGGSEHAWGTHWIALGSLVAGGQLHGAFPSLTLGGPDDGDSGGNGRFVPYHATEQVAATALAWLGLPASRFDEVLPNLRNFPQKTLGFLAT